EIKAGDSHLVELKPGEAFKIFTGAAVPDSAQAVIQIEKVTFENSKLFLHSLAQYETNVRPIGEQILKNDLALSKGTVLNAAAIGFLAGLGITTVKVFKKPNVGIVVTGNELVKPGSPLEYGKVYESNGVMLHTALQTSYYNEVKMYQVKDNFESTKSILNDAITQNDIVLVSGGISVGDYDFVAQALNELQVETLFYKVNQKPGKPLFAGKIQNKIIFALPGNPAACLTCFYIYVLPLLNMISGKSGTFQQTISKRLNHDYVVNNSRSQFLKVKVENDEVTILSHQNSSMLNSFAIANGLLFLPEGNYELKKDSIVDVYQILN
ncbi:MAG TPA: molybdopterin molybdotransferase MoeA, partial [Flavobacterium sp.]|nr:molybdopterin molybdotransferase MoeA [Flavobacterium sp.]